jgi:hypothetical protein
MRKVRHHHIVGEQETVAQSNRHREGWGRYPLPLLLFIKHAMFKHLLVEGVSDLS